MCRGLCGGGGGGGGNSVGGGRRNQARGKRGVLADAENKSWRLTTAQGNRHGKTRTPVTASLCLCEGVVVEG